MVLNTDNCHFMVLGRRNYTCILTCYGTTAKCSEKEKVLNLTIEDKLTFTQQLGNIIKKVNQKLHALSRVKCYVGLNQ